MITASDVNGRRSAALPVFVRPAPEEAYSAFYKRQLRLAVMDDFAACEGGVHKYADEVVRRLMGLMREGRITGLQESWIASPDDASHPFHGRNLRNFFAGKDSAFAIWAVLDLYMKAKHPVIARGFRLDGYLERLGLVTGDFLDMAGGKPANVPSLTLHLGQQDQGPERLIKIEPLDKRSFGLCRWIERYGEPITDEASGLTDWR
ncbi:MAG: hypothetical protein V2I43_06820, partial [Parvularcula sp.]|nr:hypothetical protein [Parvularcula sp.]